MDYGKIAYMRLEEIERILAQKTTARVKNTAFTAYPDFPLREGNDYDAVTANGTGSLTAIVKFAVLCECAGKVSLYAGSKKAESFTFLEPGAAERIGVFPLMLLESSILKLKAEEGFIGHLSVVNVALFGESAAVYGKRNVFSADECNGISAVLYGKDERIFLRTARIQADGTETVSLLTVGYGSVADVCVSPGGFIFAAFCDHAGNLFLIKVSSATGGVLRKKISGRVQSVAVSTAGDGVILAFVRSQKPLFLRLHSDLTGGSGEFQPGAFGLCDAVAFVKQAVFSPLVISESGKLFLKERVREIENSESFAAHITAAATAV